MPLQLPRGWKRAIPRARIARRVKTLAREIRRVLAPVGQASRLSIGAQASRLSSLATDRQDACPTPPLAVVVLNGAFIFGADLLRALGAGFPLDVAFVQCRSYGARTRSSGEVTVVQDLDAGIPLRGRTVLLIDDILDTGLTLKFLVNHLRRRGAGEVRVCVLLRRRARRAQRPQADFVGFDVGPGFFVGYGLDYDGQYRHLEDLVIRKCSSHHRGTENTEQSTGTG